MLIDSLANYRHYNMFKQLIFGILILTTTVSCSRQLSIDQVKLLADKMLISNKYSINVKKMSEVKNDVQIALVDLPYREFPNIIIFKFDKDKNEWVRILEGLCSGIQDNPSGLLDWHTIGTGIDFKINDDTIFNLDDKKVRVMIDAMNDSKGILIPYQNFLHMHTGDSAENKVFEPYTIDKSKYYDFANQLFNNRYATYPKEECTMFDSPKTLDFEFNFVDGKYVIKATTDNKQIWTYTFTGVDSNNKYLVDKQISVSKIL